MQRRCRKARNNWIEAKCREVKSLFKLGKVDATHRKIRENLREKRINTNIVRNENGKALTKADNKVSRWVIYMERLYRSNVVADP